MTHRQIQLVRQSWNAFQKIDPEIVGEMFYDKLFRETPALRKLFPACMDEQYKKLTDMLSTIVARLDREESIIPQLHLMAQRHAGYGVETHHYELIGKALVWTLQQGYGKNWDLEIQSAWEACYSDIVFHMTHYSETSRNSSN